MQMNKFHSIQHVSKISNILCLKLIKKIKFKVIPKFEKLGTLNQPVCDNHKFQKYFAKKNKKKGKNKLTSSCHVFLRFYGIQ